MMILFTVALTSAGLLAAAAVVCFSWSIPAARLLLRCAMSAATVGAVLGIVGGGGVLSVGTILFACGAFGCCANASRNLADRPGRWIHRFVIYAGYGATFASMAAAGAVLDSRRPSGWTAAGIWIGAYILGSGCIFLAKALTLRRIARTMPEYLVSVEGGQDGTGYW